MTFLGFLQRLAGSLVAHPVVYRLVQRLAGQARVAARLRRVLPTTFQGDLILDVGSAEGGFAGHLGISPVFVDVDARMLLALRRGSSAARVVTADASALPFPDGAFRVSLLVAVAHHLGDELFERVAADLARVTRGTLVVLDPTRNDRRLLSRWLWTFDRGRNPRTSGELENILSRRFKVTSRETFRILHEYVLLVLEPR